MKKYIGVISVVVLCLILTGCKGKKIVTTCTSSSKQTNYEISTKYIINSRENIVENVIVNQTITSKDENLLKEFEKQLKEQYKSNKSLYGGYTSDVKINGKKVVSKVTINYEELNMKKFVKDNGAMKDYVNKENKFTLEGAKKLYKSTGAKCE